MCDATTHDPDDMLLMDLKYRERTGEIYVMRWSPKHRWVYFPWMEVNQALLLKTYDMTRRRMGARASWATAPSRIP